MRLFERKGLSLGSGLISVWGNLRPPPSLPHPPHTLLRPLLGSFPSRIFFFWGGGGGGGGYGALLG